MRNIYKTVLTLGLLIAFANAWARDSLVELDFEQALLKGYEEGVISKDFTFKLAGQQHKRVKKELNDTRTNKKTNGFGKSDEKSCTWVLLSALKTLQDKANSVGANAVIDIKSNYKNREFVSSSKYQCGAGFLMSGVALKGKIVILAD